MNQTLTSWVNMGMNEGLRWQVENYFTYDQQVGRHHFTAVLGQSAMSYSYVYVSGTDYNLKETNPAMAYIDSAIGSTDDERTSGDTTGEKYLKANWNHYQAERQRHLAMKNAKGNE